MRQARVRAAAAVLGYTRAVFTMSITSTQPHLTVAAAGPAALGELSALVAFVAELARSQGHTRVLVDLSATELTLSFTDHLRFAGTVWELLGGLERVGAVVAPGFLDGPAARAARVAGMPLRTFQQPCDAAAWIAAADARVTPLPATPSPAA